MRYGSYKVLIASERLVENEVQTSEGKFTKPDNEVQTSEGNKARSLHHFTLQLQTGVKKMQ